MRTRRGPGLCLARSAARRPITFGGRGHVEAPTADSCPSLRAGHPNRSGHELYADCSVPFRVGVDS